MDKERPQRDPIKIQKWDGGRGALLCNKCRAIIATGFDHEDREHFCTKCKEKENE